MSYGHDQNAHPISRRTVLRGAAGLGLAAASGTLLTACGSGGGNDEASAPEADGPPETTTIRLYSLPPVDCIAAMYLAEPLLREEGFTDVQYVPVTAKDGIAKIVAGDIDFAIGFGALFLPQIDNGAPIVILGGTHLGCWQVIATGDIKSINDLKGKTIAIFGGPEAARTPRFTDGIFFATTLANVGLDVNRDVTVVSYPPTEYARLLSSGELDAVCVIPPLATALRANGIGRVVLNSMIDPPWSNYYCCGPTVHRAWMEKHPVATKRALRAVIKAADAIARDPDGAARFMVDRGYTNNFDYTCDLLKKEMPHDVWRQDFDPADSTRFYSLRLKEAGVIKSTPDEILERGTDFTYFTQLKKELASA